MILFYNGNGEDCVLKKRTQLNVKSHREKFSWIWKIKRKKLFLMTFSDVCFLAIELALQVCYTATLLEEEKKNFSLLKKTGKHIFYVIFLL